MSVINRHPVMSYLIAAAGVVLAGLSPWWLTPLIGDTPPMRLMLVVVVGISAWLGGLGPGLFATVMGLVAIVVTNDAPGDWASPELEARPVRLARPLDLGALQGAARLPAPGRDQGTRISPQ